MSHQTDIEHAVEAVGLQSVINHMVGEYGAAIILEALSTHAGDRADAVKAFDPHTRSVWSQIKSNIDRAHSLAEENEV